MARVVLSLQAREDIENIWYWIAEQGGERQADRVLQRISAGIDRLEHFPVSGAPRDEILPDLRGLVCERWIAFYRVDNDAVLILRVIDGARDIGAVFA